MGCAQDYTRPKVEATVSTNVLGTRLLFSPHWNKELRLPSLSVARNCDNSRDLFSFWPYS